MINDIKLDGILGELYVKKDQPEIKQPVSANTEGVTVTDTIKNLIDSAHFEDVSLEEDARIVEVRQSIENNTYPKDLDILSDKLLKGIFANR